MADDDVLDVLRVEAERRQTVDDLGLRGPGEVRIEDDQPVAGAQRPRGVLARAEPIEIVEALVRRGVPRPAIRRRRRRAASRPGATRRRTAGSAAGTGG